MKTLRWIFAPVAMHFSLVAALADHYFCAGIDNAWNNGGNWKLASDCSGADAGVPTLANKVIILSGKTCNVDITTAVADRIVVESTATLNIDSGKLLRVDSGGGSSTVDGTLNLQGASSELEFTDSSPTLSGSGNIVGLDNAAEITIATGLILTSNILIEGKLTIAGLGTFNNQGDLVANRHGTLLVDSDFIDDIAGAEWKVSAATGPGSGEAILQMSHGYTVFLDGDFVVGNGKLDVDKFISTDGRLAVTNGATIDCLGAIFSAGE